MLDLKGRSPSVGRSVASLLHELGRDHAVLACGRQWRSVDALTRLPYVRRVLSARNRVELARLRQRLETSGPEYGVSVHRSLLDPTTVAELKRHVDVLMTWPVNDIPTLDRLLDIGVTGIISDEDAVLAELIGRR